MQHRIKIKLMEELYGRSEYNMVSFFPKSADDIKAKGTDHDFSDTAIVLQGPVIGKDRFTEDTVRLYKQYYNNVTVIVSTWSDTDQSALDRLRALGAHVVLSGYPDTNGVGNVNYQLTTSLAGVRKAGELGVRFVLKARTDQRFYNPCALSILLGMYQPDKIVTMGGIYNSFCAKSFQLCDFMAFGSVNELEMLYTLPLDGEDTRGNKLTRHHQNDDVPFFNRYIEFVRHSEENCNAVFPNEFNGVSLQYSNPETMLIYGYFCKEDSLENYSTVQEAYLSFIKKRIVVVDADSLGFFWPKYTNMYFRKNYFDREGKMDMGRWLSIVQDDAVGK